MGLVGGRAAAASRGDLLAELNINGCFSAMFLAVPRRAGQQCNIAFDVLRALCNMPRLRGLSDEGFYTQAILAQAMGGPRAGTAYMSLWQQMAGGTMFSRTAEGMQDVGLLKPGEWRTDHGCVILDKEASQRLTKLIGKDPLDLAANLVEHFKETGVTDPMEQMRLTMRALGRQTTQRYTAEEVTNFHQMVVERQRAMAGMGGDSSFGLINDKSVTANMVALQNAWTNLPTAVAGPNAENAIAIMKELTSAINAMTRYVNGMNPETLKTIAEGIGALGLALSGALAVTLLVALGPAGWIVLGIGAVVAAAAKWGPDVFKAIWSGLESMAAALDKFIAFLAGLGDKIKGILSGLGIDPADHGSHPGRDGRPGHKDKTMFNPGQAPVKATPISLSLNVDGRTLAQVISEKLDGLYRYDTNSPAFNGAGRYGI
jgi:hypothetical protein